MLVVRIRPDCLGTGRKVGQMTIRDKPIYLSTEVYRWLWLLAKAEPPVVSDVPCGSTSSRTYSGMVTLDEIADQILRQAIREQHPTLMEHQAKIDEMEKELVKSLRTELNR